MTDEKEKTKGEAEFKEWLTHPTTKLLMKWLGHKQATLKEDWAGGKFTDLSQYGTAILNAKAIGQCEMLDDVINVEYEDIEEQADE